MKYLLFDEKYTKNVELTEDESYLIFYDNFNQSNIFCYYLNDVNKVINIEKEIRFIFYDKHSNSIFYQEEDKLICFNLISKKEDLFLTEFYPRFWVYNSDNRDIIYVDDYTNILTSFNIQSKYINVLSNSNLDEFSWESSIKLNFDNKYIATIITPNSKMDLKKVKIFNIENGKEVAILTPYNIEDDYKFANHMYYTYGPGYPYHPDWFEQCTEQYNNRLKNYYYAFDYGEIYLSFNKNNKELLISYSTKEEFIVKIFDTQNWELINTIYDDIQYSAEYISEDIIYTYSYLENQNVSYRYKKSSPCLYNIASKKVIKFFDKHLYIFNKLNKYGKFIEENGEKYFEIKDIEDILNE